jgi:hypothetical protein
MNVAYLKKQEGVYDLPSMSKIYYKAQRLASLLYDDDHADYVGIYQNGDFTIHVDGLIHIWYKGETVFKAGSNFLLSFDSPYGDDWRYEFMRLE